MSNAESTTEAVEDNAQLRKCFEETLINMYSNVKYANNYIFYAHLISQCKLKFSNSLPTLGVMFDRNQYVMVINLEFFNGLTLDKRCAALKHEMLHILSGHLTSRNFVNRNNIHTTRLHNIAADCAINQLIDEEHIDDNWVTYKSFKEMLDFNGVDTTNLQRNQTYEYYYSFIQQAIDDNDKGDKGGKGEEAGEGSSSGEFDARGMDSIDDHSAWGEQNYDENIKNATTEKMIKSSCEATMKNKGNVPRQISDFLELVSLKSKVNWKQVLKNIVSNKKANNRLTVYRKDRRQPHRQDLRGKLKERTFELLVVADVSGSVNQEELMKCIIEIKGLCEQTKTDVRLIQVDSEAFDSEIITKNIKTFQRKGSGGTMLYKAIEQAKFEKLYYDCVVFLTDGHLFDDDIENISAIKKKVVVLTTDKVTDIPNARTIKI